MKSEMAFLTSGVLFAATALTAYSDFIYDVDFEDPPHILGSAPAAGGGTDRPTSSGNFIVAGGVADFTSQVALMETNTVGGGMAFAPGTVFTASLLRLSWEWALVAGDDSESVLQTSVQVNGTEGPNPRVHVTYLFDGSVVVTDPVGGSINVATFVTNQSASYQLLLDLDNDMYNFSIDGLTLVTNRSMQAGADVSIFGFQRPFGSPSFAIDNVQWEVIPEPTTAILLLLGALGLAAGRPRKEG